jgi:hypothetical protein
MYAVEVPVTRENYLRLYLWLYHRIKPSDSLPVDESILPPMFRRPKYPSVAARKTDGQR